MIKKVNTFNVYQTESLGFSQGVLYDNLVFLSGQVGWDKNFQLADNSTFEDQLKQVMVNIENILIAGGGKMDNILHMRFYVKDLKVEIEVISKKKKYEEFFDNTGNYALCGL